MDRIMLNDLLRFDDEQIESARIKFNLNNSYFDAVERYRSDPERFNNRNLLWHINHRYFQVGQIGLTKRKARIMGKCLYLCPYKLKFSSRELGNFGTGTKVIR